MRLTATMAILGILSFGYYLFCGWKVSFRSSVLYFWPLLGAFFTVSAFFHGFFWLFAPLFFLFWFLFFTFFLIANGIQWGKVGDRKPRVLVLLGVRNDGTLPEALFSDRVRLCAQRMAEDPEVKAVICGGKVFSERISEAEGMANALEKLGVSRDRLILEDSSRTTVENFARLAPLLGRDHGGIGVISSSYHRFRAVLIARAVLGEKNVSFFGAPTPAYFAFHLYLREFFTFSVDLVAGRMSGKKK